MKRKTVKICFVTLCCVVFAAAALCIGFIVAGKKTEKTPSEAKAAAMPAVSEQVAPELSGKCGVCGEAAYCINTLSELAYVFTHDGEIPTGGGGAKQQLFPSESGRRLHGVERREYRRAGQGLRGSF